MGFIWCTKSMTGIVIARSLEGGYMRFTWNVGLVLCFPNAVSVLSRTQVLWEAWRQQTAAVIAGPISASSCGVPSRSISPNEDRNLV